MANPSVLDLDSLVDRPVVLIGRKEYRLYTVDLLPPLENYRVKKLLARTDELSGKDDLSRAEEKELEALLDKVVRIVLEAPDAIHKKLTDKQRVEVIQTFYVPSLLLKYAATATDAAAPQQIPTGETSPAPSPDSIQATTP